MTQEQIMELLEQNPNRFYTDKMIASILCITASSVGRATRQIVKREGYMFQYTVNKRSVRMIGYIENE